ncbi:6-phospho-beta-glucosidase [Sinosporangium siamense]|uniref:6-phospho-beta-glucosidase n=1 Tax=Sinosporangium siamense TaxID=1367973 RepID=A0A919RQF4_9ACTN|nr:6-phospho-beta-glucosidase [Sinosporangium siamense]GII97377.1 6-phospho-beta-glucosidase [Sinosporangium siamense]
MTVKIAVVGGGSTYTPELVEGFATRHDRLPVGELVLLDTDRERLDVVGGLAGRMLDRLGWPGRLTLTTDTDAALDGADYILVQLRVGGQAARNLDETIPPKWGTIGQETTGAGGLAKALRTVPVVLDLAERAARRANTDHWIIDFTNPVGIVTQALLDAGHRAIGLCNVAIGFQRQFADFFGVAPERVELEHVGLNHLTWERAVRIDGVDRLPELLAAQAEMLASSVDMPAELIHSVGAIPSYYLRYYYMFPTVLAEQHSGGATRAEEVTDIERRLLEMYRDPALAHKPELLTKRGGAYYSEAAAQLVASLHADTGDIQVVNVRNDGALPDLPANAVVEVPARITRAGASPLPLSPLAPGPRGIVQKAKAYEDLAVQAALTGNRADALTALLANPLVPGWDTAVPLLDEMLAANLPYLPPFATHA